MPGLLTAAFLTLPLHAADVDLQGHRGARAQRPENTLAGFRYALEVGVDTLELDLAVTTDGVVVVSHDPALSPAIVRGADGQWIHEPVSIHALTFAQIQQFDVGRLEPGTPYAGRFGSQQAQDGARIPALAEVFALDEAVRFNIETKLDPTKPHLTPTPEAFVDAVMGVIEQAGVGDRVTIQSFDWRTLALARGRVPTVCLTHPETVKPGSPWTGALDPKNYETVPALVEAAGCAVWSPDHESLTQDHVADAAARGLQVVPWTVNDPARAAVLLEWGVDGLITDDPALIKPVAHAKP